MKITLIVVLLSAVQILANSVYSQNTRFTLAKENVTVENVLSTIEDQSEFYFLYNSKLVDVMQKVNIIIENQNLEKTLSELFKGTNIAYKIYDRQVVLMPEEGVEFNSQQQKSISGKVTDSTGAGLPGVSVVVKGTTTGVITDVDGKYMLSKVPENATLQFSFVGMKAQEIAVGGKTSINVTLTEETVGLEEVVAVGYGVQKKKLVTGSTVQITGDNLQKINSISPLTAMQSQSPGLSITQTSGKPGSDYKINIRGLGTIGNATPLIIIDGVVGGDLNLINPADIESLDILKDAASAAIYGARAANGVILIRTRQGHKGKNTISYDGYFGIQNVAKYVDMVDAQTYLNLQEEAHRNSGSPIPDWSKLIPTYNLIQQGWKGTDWQREFTNENAPVQNHSINTTGGSDISTYSIGMSYTSQEGVYGQPDSPEYKRYSFRLNSEHVIYNNSSFDVFKIGENLLYNYVNQKHDGLGTSNISWNDIRWVTRMQPTMPVYDENGDFTKVTGWGDKTNPIGAYTYQRSGNESSRNNLRINTYIEIQPVKNLVFRSNFGYQFSANRSRAYVPVYDLGGQAKESIDRVDQSLSSGHGYQFENTINYKLSINDAHYIDALIGQSIEKSGIGESVYGSNRGSIFDTFEYAYLSNVKTLNPSNVILNGTPLGENKLSSFFGRVNYNYKETYIASVILRADGSSNFAPDKRWGYFPSFATGWILTNEPFMNFTKNVMDYLKLRISWGQNGNQNILPFQYLAIYSFSGADYYFGPEKNSSDVGAYPSILPNKDVTWETSEQLNIGLDSRFFDSRLGISADWYNKITRDWLVQAPVPAVWGAAAPYINGGDIENKGIELVFNWNDNIGDFTYGINANIAFNKNEVTRIANTEGVIEGGNTIFSTSDRSNFYRAQVGYPIGYFYGYKTLGVFQNQAEIDSYNGAKLTGTKPGDLIYLDTDNSGVIDSKDKTMIGDPNPNAIYGLSVNLGYKGFDFSISANGVYGNQIASSLRQVDGLYDNWPAIYLDRWHGEGTSNRYPRIYAGTTPSWGWNSDIYVDNGDFLRLQNMTLGYDFKKLMPDFPFSQSRIYFAINNLYTFTSYYGPDPEVGHANEGWSKGIDVGFYPMPRTLMFGLNLKF